MSSFLQEFDEAIEAARIHGKPGRLWEFDDDPDGPYPIARLVARTMHPSFMAPPMPKHDPERDQ